jgi:hypothetical protein
MMGCAARFSLKSPRLLAAAAAAAEAAGASSSSKHVCGTLYIKV